MADGGGAREQGRWPDYCNPDGEYIVGDVRDREALRKPMQGMDVIFHLAAAVGVGQSMYEIERYVDANTRGTAVLLDTLVSDATIGDGIGTERAFTACSQPGHQLFSPGRT